jgi:FtsZ-binding cell division protein ZapB
MGKLKDQLAGIAALVAAIVAIGGGFVKYGEVMTKLEVLEGASKGIDMSFLSEIEVLKEKVNSLSTEHGHTKILVNEKQIELLQVQIEEIKTATSNPLAN